MDIYKKELFLKALNEMTVTSLAKEIGVSRKTIYKHMKKMGIDPFKINIKKTTDSKIDKFLESYHSKS